MNERIFPPLAMLVCAACIGEAEPRLLLPDGIEVAWEEAYNLEGDGLGALVPVDVMAYDGATGEPLSDVELAVWTDDGGAWPVPAEGVVWVGPDDAAGPELGGAFWDASRDQFVMLELADDPVALATDSSGLARSYLYVDAFPEGTDDEPYAPIAVVVTMSIAPLDGDTAERRTEGNPRGGESILLQPW